MLRDHSFPIPTTSHWESNETIFKSPLWKLDHALRETTNMAIMKCGIDSLANASDNAFVIVGQSNNIKKQSALPHNHHQPITQPLKHQNNNKTQSTMVVWVPSGSIFFSHHATSPLSESLSPLPDTWLRVRRDDGHPAKGGFFRSFKAAYVIQIIKPIFPVPLTNYMVAHHVEDLECPFPPTFIEKRKQMTLQRELTLAMNTDRIY